MRDGPQPNAVLMYVSESGEAVRRDSDLILVNSNGQKSDLHHIETTAA